MTESSFQSKLIQDLRTLFPGCIILKNDPNYLQGFPDLLILYHNKWAALEVKDNECSSLEPNQAHYITLLDRMSYASFIYPKNKRRILNELQQTLRSRW
jgi:hypothetical protein